MSTQTGSLEYADLGAGAQLGLELKKLHFANAVRVQEALTASLERKALHWIAERLPAWVNSDYLTALGFAAQFLAGASYALAGWNRYALLAATFFIAVNWFGDSLDGTLARLRSRQRPRYGFYVDHVIDTFGAAFLMGGLAISGFLHWQVAAAMLVGFLMLSIEVYLATYTLGNFQLSYWKFGPTEIRILLAIGNAVLFFRPTVHVLGSPYRLFDVGGVIAAAAMAGIMVVSAVRHTIALYRLERLP
jgi:phosphatidylglycerophosphate synthase